MVSRLPDFFSPALGVRTVSYTTGIKSEIYSSISKVQISIL